MSPPLAPQGLFPVTSRNRSSAVSTSPCFQPDGDLMYAPGVRWTAARHKIPLLAVMHNNRGYHQEVMHRAAHVELPQAGAATGTAGARSGAGVTAVATDAEAAARVR